MFLKLQCVEPDIVQADLLSLYLVYPKMFGKRPFVKGHKSESDCILKQ